jgi:hypothetical protein
MHDYDDVWFVRLPNGKVLRANATQAVRDSLRDGHIPLTSEVRRSSDDDWLALEWVEAFADLVHRRTTNDKGTRRIRRPRPTPTSINLEDSSIAARLDSKRLPSSGVRRMLGELLPALDRALVRDRLGVGLVLGAVAGLLVAIVESGWLSLVVPETWMLWVVVAPLLLILGAVGAGLVSRGAYAELSRMRPGSWQDSVRGLGPLAFRVGAAWLLTGGSVFLAIGGLRWFTGWMMGISDLGWPTGLQAGLTGVIGLLAILGELGLWVLLILTSLLPAVLVAEECGVVRGLGHWLQLLRAHALRVWLYEALAVGLGVLMVGAFLVPVILAVSSGVGGDRLAPVLAFAMRLLGGAAVGGLFAYLMVANLFIYLNLRYASIEQGHPRK